MCAAAFQTKCDQNNFSISKKTRISASISALTTDLTILVSYAFLKHRETIYKYYCYGEFDCTSFTQ